MTGGRLSWRRVQQHIEKEMFWELSPWLLRKLFLFCMFKVSFLARLASRHLLADTPSFSTYIFLYTLGCFLWGKKKNKKRWERKHRAKVTWFSIFCLGCDLTVGDLFYHVSEHCQWLPESFIWPLHKPSSTIYWIILRDKLLQ